MPHAVYQRGHPHAKEYRAIGGFWKVFDPRTPNWYLTADTKPEVLRIWYEEWRHAQRNGW